LSEYIKTTKKLKILNINLVNIEEKLSLFNEYLDALEINESLDFLALYDIRKDLKSESIDSLIRKLGQLTKFKVFLNEKIDLKLKRL